MSDASAADQQGRGPRPDTTRAVLMSAGIPPRFTWHVFDHSELELDARGRPSRWVFFYRCSETNKLRAWGHETA